MKKSKFKSAAKQYDTAASSGGKTSNLAFKRGAAHYQAKNYTKAVSALKPLEAKGNAKAGKLFVQANLNLATTNKSNKAAYYSEAKRAAGSLVSAKPGSAEYVELLSAAELGLKNFGAAIDGYNSLVRMKPNQASAYLNLAQAHMGKGDWNSATASLEKGIAACKPDATMNRFLGMSREKLAGKTVKNETKIAELEKAVAAYTKASSISKTSQNRDALTRAQANLDTARENKAIDADNVRTRAENEAASRENEEIERENERRAKINRIIEQEFGAACDDACKACAAKCAESDKACQQKCTTK